MIQLVKMKPVDFKAYLAAAVPEYAAHHTRSGKWSADAEL